MYVCRVCVCVSVFEGVGWGCYGCVCCVGVCVGVCVRVRARVCVCVGVCA